MCNIIEIISFKNGKKKKNPKIGVFNFRMSVCFRWLFIQEYRPEIFTKPTFGSHQ